MTGNMGYGTYPPRPADEMRKKGSACGTAFGIISVAACPISAALQLAAYLYTFTHTFGAALASLVSGGQTERASLAPAVAETAAGTALAVVAAAFGIAAIVMYGRKARTGGRSAAALVLGIIGLSVGAIALIFSSLMISHLADVAAFMISNPADVAAF